MSKLYQVFSFPADYTIDDLEDGKVESSFRGEFDAETAAITFAEELLALEFPAKINNVTIHRGPKLLHMSSEELLIPFD